MKTYDFVIFGGGIFGAYAALYLSKKKYKILLVEKEKALFTKASIVNQARLHGGYHYPRSVATALMSDENKARFTSEHQAFINNKFDKYYAIDRFGSFTDAAQFERFCSFLNLPCQPIKQHTLFNFQRIETLFLTCEYSFDPVLIAQYYEQLLNDDKNICVLKYHKVLNAENTANTWQINIQNIDNQNIIKIKTNHVINATYTAINSINRIFGVAETELLHEISEIAFVNSKQAANLGLTVMDGQFGSLMPYGLSGLLSLSSVAYTHHKASYDPMPIFDCQKINQNCTPDFTSICSECAARPISNAQKMLAQMKQYFNEKIDFEYQKSIFTIKSKLKSSHIDDGRPTEIKILHENPNFYCLFAGKINSIYEVEKIIG